MCAPKTKQKFQVSIPKEKFKDKSFKVQTLIEILVKNTKS